jgi:hypothetical protein
MLLESRKMSLTRIDPAKRYRPIAAIPAEAMQPHSQHAGLPPN